ncbi:hypothetical protein ACFFJY_09270 [Fictibacillus aquaticus]|uniref:Uncharacterized protein n=1 Tax=Fictibacillus aquaticus TaxID=2021314 RepID=A0A235FCE8_9BACL|nr:hypothetical protein [Fictibacillus aquaticus]OYD58465.1 hypothetical protein CGZ90_00760 [Fictibacillus aquaticus]
MKIAKLDMKILGEKAVAMALAAHLAKHKKVSSTAKDYIMPGEDHPEAMFMRDLFALTTEEIIDKWFDGSENADDLIYSKK